MSVEGAFERFRSIGRTNANVLFPNDFEMYFTAFELVNSNDQTVDYFAFPLNPEQIQEIVTEITNIKKTNSGITTLSNSTFIPVQITIKGDFGRKFRALVGRNVEVFSAFFKGEFSKIKEFDGAVKTGYGCIKVIDQIFKKAKRLDDNNLPHTLYFYNLSLGNSYVVKLNTIAFSQSMERNMVWGYNLTMTAVADLKQIKDDQINEQSRAFTTQNIQSSISNIANQVGSL